MSKPSGTFTRPVAKVLVFSLASLGLLAADHPGRALALVVFSILINACAELAPARRLQQELSAR